MPFSRVQSFWVSEIEVIEYSMVFGLFGSDSLSPNLPIFTYTVDIDLKCQFTNKLVVLSLLWQNCWADLTHSCPLCDIDIESQNPLRLFGEHRVNTLIH